MFRFLLVEDHQQPAEELAKLLPEVFPAAAVEVAHSVAAALQLIEQAKQDGRAYDAAILDFKLPASLGEHVEVDESVCWTLRKRQAGTLIFHITGYPEDEKIRAHLLKAHTEPGDSGAFVISKRQADWPSQLTQKIKNFLYGALIENRLAALFDASPSSELFPHQRRSRSARGSRDLTHALAALQRDIGEHWDDLDERTQQLVKEHFLVDEAQRPIRMSLL
jgi:CheY-like chemotaxis protein